MNKTHRAWRASFTRRWHTNPDLCDTLDYDCGHQGRVALLILSLFPQASRTLLCHAITHDQGEAAVGDISYEVKKRHPEIHGMSDVIEGRERKEQGFWFPNLTETEVRILKLCDHLDAWLWMQRHARHLSRREDWTAQRKHMREEALWLGVGPEVNGLVWSEEARVPA
jgi:hypothetical protein